MINLHEASQADHQFNCLTTTCYFYILLAKCWMPQHFASSKFLARETLYMFQGVCLVYKEHPVDSPGFCLASLQSARRIPQVRRKTAEITRSLRGADCARRAGKPAGVLLLPSSVSSLRVSWEASELRLVWGAGAGLLGEATSNVNPR